MIARVREGTTRPGMTPTPGLLLEADTRRELWRRLADAIEGYTAAVPDLRVTPRLDREALLRLLAPFTFEEPVPPFEALSIAVDGLRAYQVHTPHPRYFGLFNPAPTTMGIVADALVAAFNPQIAAWSHSPLAAEIEAHLCRAIGSRLGYAREDVDGTFCSGGAEANHTALLAALTAAFASFADGGVRALPAAPVFYTSAHGHHSFHKAARLTGLGSEAAREIPVDGELRMDAGALAARVAADRAAGLAPFLVVATAGTTGTGAVDPIPQIAAVARREGLWLHVDAAWGAAAAFVPELAPVLDGIAGADSLTFDAHKWLSVPMGAGLFLTRHPRILGETFRVAAGYMPKDAAGMEVVDPFAHSMQWSRRFIGLKVFLSLAAASWDGYAEAIRRMTAMGDRLRDRLREHGFAVVNTTPLPVVCAVDSRSPEGASPAYIEALVRAVVESGRAWVSSIRLPDGTAGIRACITNFRTGPEDVDALVLALHQARSEVRAGGAASSPRGAAPLPDLARG